MNVFKVKGRGWKLSAATMVLFCEPGDTDNVVWRGNGFSRCFVTIVGSLFSSGFLIVFGLSIIVLGGKPKAKPNGHNKWRPLLHSKSFLVEVVACLLMAVIFAVKLILHGLLPGGSIYGYMIVTNVTSCVAWLFCLLMIYRERFNVLFTLHHSIPVVLFWLANIVWLCFDLASWSNKEWWWHLKNKVDITDLVLFCVQFCVLVILISVGILRPLLSRRRQYQLLVNIEVPEAPLPLDSQEDDHYDSEMSGNFIRNQSHASAFTGFMQKAKVIFPYIWPKGHPMLQLRVIVCFLILAIGRVVNLYVPIYYKKIVNALTPKQNITDSLDLAYGMTVNNTGITFPLVSISIYIVLRFLQGGSIGNMGFTNNARSYLWIRVQQYTMRAMQRKLFSHLHDLSLRWHLGRKTGEVMRVIDRGTLSINNLLDYVLFNIFPMMIDIGVAVCYFIIAFNAWFGLIVFTTMGSYLIYTIGIIEWRTKYRREMNKLDNEVKAKAVDSLLNFETVKYYGQEKYEVDRFNDAILRFQREEWKTLATLNVLNSGQNVVITLGLMAGSMLCAYR